MCQQYGGAICEAHYVVPKNYHWQGVKLDSPTVCILSHEQNH
jgi:hypothetical protein